MMTKWFRRAALLGCAALVAGCATPTPTDQGNICAIFEQEPGWYEDAVQMQKEWGTPINVAMAIIEEESHFHYDAQPPEQYFLGFIPTGRASSAYGYSQAQDPVWDEYVRATGDSGSRTDFRDSIMFVGWYTHETRRILGISLWDPYRQYLAYHEGRSGYEHKTYLHQPWLMRVARKVERNAKTYDWQLRRCRKRLEEEEHSWFF